MVKFQFKAIYHFFHWSKRGLWIVDHTSVKIVIVLIRSSKIYANVTKAE